MLTLLAMHKLAKSTGKFLSTRTLEANFRLSIRHWKGTTTPLFIRFIYRRVSSQFRESRVGVFWEESLTIFFDLSLFFDAFWKQRFLKMRILALYNSNDLPLAAKDRKMNTPVNNRKIKLNIFQTKSYRDWCRFLCGCGPNYWPVVLSWRSSCHAVWIEP